MIVHLSKIRILFTAILRRLGIKPEPRQPKIISNGLPGSVPFGIPPDK